MSTEAPSDPAPRGRPAWWPFALGIVLVVVVAGLFLVLRGGGGDASSADAGASAASGATGPQSGPVAVSPARLAALAEAREEPLFWVGPAPGATYELTRTADGSAYVRYLDRGAAVGDSRPDFLTVGTYAREDAYAQVSQAAARTGAQVERLPDDGLAVANRARPNSWYLAYPDAKQFVEVFSPRRGRARALVRDGRVVPVAP